MRRMDINRDWTLQPGEPSNIPGMPAQKRTVHLPHDYMIETDVTPKAKNGVNGGCYEGSIVSYTKMLDIPADWEGQRVLIRFDGCAGLAKIVANGHVAGHHHYGYTPFDVDITRFLTFGKQNRLTVTVGTDAGPNSRWYPGTGLYRHVQLLHAPKVHLAVEGVYAHVDHMVNGDAFVTVETTVENHTGEDVYRWVSLTASAEDGQAPAAEGRIRVFVPAGETAVCRTTLCFENAEIWDIDDPRLYTIRAELTDGNEITDAAETIFGVREITVDARNGFRLNGRSIKLKGGCIHSDNGILGAASFYDSEYRKVKLHKDNGFNALRFAHNPVSSEMLEACDRLGMLVFDEAFDTWNMPKNFYDFSQFFEKEGMVELEAFIKRDRNHPCVAIWSIGNELPEQGGLSDGYKTSAALAAKVRDLDATRPVAGALCSFFNGLDDEDCGKFWQSLMQSAMKSGGSISNLDSDYGRSIWNDYTEAFAAPWDIVGYNYLNYHYEEAGKLFPNRVILATESKPREIEAYWADVEKYPYLIGDFEWTSHDYLGEAGIGKVVHVEKEQVQQAAQMMSYSQYPWRLANCGDFDLCGFPKPQLAFKRIVWGSEETYIAVKDPLHYGKVELVGRYGWTDCAHSWTWPIEPGSPIEVEVYSSADEVELLLNGKSLGKEMARNTAKFSLTYEPGVLEAISYTDGKEVSRDKLETYGKPVGLKLTPDKTVLTADGDSLCFVKVEAVDKNGNPVPYVEAKTTVKAEGAAQLVAFGTGRGCTEENYTKGEITLYKGTALAILRSGTEAGIATLTVSAEELGTDKKEFRVL
ncbi:MAG: glycoside hydrolase family 2 protein [Ruminococcaceae bacterium]|nr:glycoside hydrolase family 2 protein [Oscillospiraceae bacterium]